MESVGVFVIFRIISAIVIPLVTTFVNVIGAFFVLEIRRKEGPIKLTLKYEHPIIIAQHPM